jgi:hypothetical protein
MAAHLSADEPSHPLARFYRAWGYRTWSRLGTLWIDSGRFSVISVPCSCPVATSRTAVEQLLRDTGRLAAQFPTTADTGVQRNSYWVRDPGYGPAALQKQFRQHVSRHRGRCEVRPVDWPELATRGYGVLHDALVRQSRAGDMTREAWQECCRVATEIPNLTATGCTVDGDLAAFLISWIAERCCYVLMYYRSPRFDDFRPSHKLIADFTRQTIRRADVDAITLGRDLVPLQGAIGDFKRHAGYQPEPISVAAVLDPQWSGVLVHGVTRGALHLLHHLTGRRSGVLANVELLEAAEQTSFP